MAGSGSEPGLRDESTAELLKRLSQETTTLVRQEIELAKAEVSEKGKTAGVGASLFGGAGVATLLALAALTGAAVAALDTAMRLWLAALIPALVWAAVAAGLALRGQREAARGHAAGPAAGTGKREGGCGMGEDPREIRQEIEQTRERMGDTVEALSYKADVKARAKESVTGKVDSVKGKLGGTPSSVQEKIAGTTSTVSDRVGGAASTVGERTPSGDECWSLHHYALLD